MDYRRSSVQATAAMVASQAVCGSHNDCNNNSNMILPNSPTDDMTPVFGETTSGLLSPRSMGSTAQLASSISRRSSCSFATDCSSNSNVIDLMEKEQEGVVLRLMKEIQQLKDENRLLKQQMAGMRPPISASSSSSSGNATPITPIPTGPSPAATNRRRNSAAVATPSHAKRLPASAQNTHISIPYYQHTPEYLASYESRPALPSAPTSGSYSRRRSRRSRSDAAPYDTFSSWSSSDCEEYQSLRSN